MILVQMSRCVLEVKLIGGKHDGQLAVIGAGLWSASLGLAFNPNDHASRYSVWFPLDSNP